MLNRYKNMIVLSAKSAEGLNEQIASLGIMFDIVSMYALGSRHYAYIVPDRPTVLVKRKAKKQPSVDELTKKMNKE